MDSRDTYNKCFTARKFSFLYKELCLSRSFFLYRSLNFYLCDNLFLFCNRCFFGILGRSGNRSIFCNNHYRYLNLNLLMEVSDSLIFTNLLDVAHSDNLTINLDALFSKSLSNFSSINRTIELACCSNLCLDFQRDTFQFSSLFLCSSLECCEFVCLLSQVLCKYFLCALACDNGFTCRNQVVTTIAFLYGYDVVLVTQSYDIFFQYNFHFILGF